MRATPFEQLKAITDRVYESGRDRFTPLETKDIVELIVKNGYKLRKDDGKLVQVNFSIPTSNDDSFVVGLRYEKKDGSNTEDHFIFWKSKRTMTAHYKGTLEGLFPEYKGTHKEQLG